MPLTGRPMLSTMRVELAGGMICADRLLDLGELARAFLDAGADLGAHMHQDLAASTDGKKLRPR
jgi:hypothetical protein